MHHQSAFRTSFVLAFAFLALSCASEAALDTSCEGDKCDDQVIDHCISVQERPLFEGEEQNGSVETATEIGGSMNPVVDFPGDVDWYRYPVSATAVLPLIVSAEASYQGFETLVCAYYINSNGNSEDQSACGEGFVARDPASGMRGCCARSSAKGGALTVDPGAAKGEFLIQVRAQPGLPQGAECGALHLDINI